MTLSEADRIYSIGRSTKISRIKVSSLEAEDLTRSSRKLQGIASELREDSLWSPLLRELKRLTCNLLTLPIPVESPELGLQRFVKNAKMVHSKASSSYPSDVLVALDLVVNHVDAFSRLESNPLGHSVLDQIEHVVDSIICIATPKHIFSKAFSTWLENHKVSAKVLSPPEIARELSIDVLYLLGPISWWPSHLLNSPRAKKIGLVQYDFVFDPKLEGGVFARSTIHKPTLMIRGSAPSVSGKPIEADDFLPVIDWDAIVSSSQGEVHSGDMRWVDAQLFALAEDHTVFLDSTEGSKTEVIEPENEGLERVYREENFNLEQGHYIICRESGSSGTFLEKIANELLGNQAELLRAKQNKWKSALQRKVDGLGVLRVEQELQDAGMSFPNVEYRLSPFSIRTSLPGDFKILLDYVGLGDSVEEIWSGMGEIAQAHRKAGRNVINSLRKQLGNLDMSKLLATGSMKIDVGESGGGSLRIIRIEGKAPDQYKIPISRLNILDSLGTNIWRE